MPYAPIAERPTKQVVLKTNPGYWVTIYSSLTYGDRKAFGAIEGNDVMIAADTALRRLVADWNLDDLNGVKLEITPENIDALDEEDVSAIMEQLVPVVQPSGAKAGAKETEKKSSTNRSSAPSADQPTG